MSTTAVYAHAYQEIFTILIQPEFGKVILVSYQPEPEFQLSTGVPVLDLVSVVP